MMSAAGVCGVIMVGVSTGDDGSSLGNENRDVVSYINGIAEELY